MIRLQDKTNVQAPDATWPFGKSTDNTGSGNGLPLNSATLEDYHQTFEKVFDESGLSANGLQDNAVNGFQLFQAFRKVFRPYNAYAALLSQSGTSAPTATVIENSLNASNITWTRIVAGSYRGTLTGAFTANKTVIFTGNGFSNLGRVVCLRNSNDEILLSTYDTSGTLADGLLNGTEPIEVRVYD